MVVVEDVGLVPELLVVPFVSVVIAFEFPAFLHFLLNLLYLQ